MKPVFITSKKNSDFVILADEDSATTRYNHRAKRHVLTYETAVFLSNMKPPSFHCYASPWKIELLDGEEVPEEPALGWQFDISAFSTGEDNKPTAIHKCGRWQRSIELMAPCPGVWSEFKNNSYDKQHYGKTLQDIVADNIRGVYKKSAIAMLTLAESAANLKTCRITKSMTFGSPRIETPNDMPDGFEFIPWNIHSFAIAWMWNHWKKREIDDKRKIILTEKHRDMQSIGYPYKIGAFEATHRNLFPKPTH